MAVQCLYGKNGEKSFRNDAGRRVNMTDINQREWLPSQLLLANSRGLVAESIDQVHALVTVLVRVCERSKLRMKVEKVKVMEVGREGVAP